MRPSHTPHVFALTVTVISTHPRKTTTCTPRSAPRTPHPAPSAGPGETIEPGEHKCSLLHFEGDDVTKVSYTVSMAELSGYVAIFTQHNPSEFEVDGGHYLTTGTTDVEAAFSVGAQVCLP